MIDFHRRAMCSCVGPAERSTTLHGLSMFRSWVACTAVLLVAGCGGTTVEPDRPVQHQEKSFVDQLRLGRQGESNEICVEHKSVSDAVLSEMTEQDAWLKTLQLDAGVITDVGLESIALLPSLRHLRLRQSPITDIGFEKLARCPSIQILNLPQCDASATGVAALSSLPELWNLRLGGSRLTASTAEALTKIPTLRNVHLIGVPINDAGLRQIVSLPNLESLYIDDAAVSREGWDWVFENHPGLHIHVDQQHHDRDPRKH